MVFVVGSIRNALGGLIRLFAAKERIWNRK